MALPDRARADLAEADQLMEMAQGKLTSAAGACDLAGVPKVASIAIRRKRNVLGYAREDLHDLPKQITQAEQRS